MQRIAEIENRRRKLQEEIASLDAEEAEIRRALAASTAIDPALLRLVQASTTQQGCAEAQQLLDSASPEVREGLFTAVLADVRSLATQTYGALFLQKLLESVGDAEYMRVLYALNVGTAFVDVAVSTSGTRTLQRLLDLFKTNETRAAFMNMVAHRMVPLVSDANACHLVQRLFNQRNVDMDPIVASLLHNCVAVSTSKQGCCVMQKALDWLTDKPRNALIDTIIGHELDLVQDPFGNYVIQHLLERKDDGLTKRTIQPLLHNIAALACNKFGSNVIEKSVRVANPMIKQLIIDELTDPSVLPRLLQDSFANYVIQTAIATCTEDQFQQLHAAIRPNASILKNSPYGVRIDTKIQRRIKDNARARQRQTKKKGGPGGAPGGQRGPDQANTASPPPQVNTLPISMPAMPVPFPNHQHHHFHHQHHHQHQQQQQVMVNIPLQQQQPVSAGDS